MGCSIEAKLKEAGYKGAELEAEIAKYKVAMEAEQAYMTMRDTKVDEHINSLLPKEPVRIYYEGGATTAGKTELLTVKKVEHDMRAATTRVIFTNNREYTFLNGETKSIPTKAGKTIESPAITDAISKATIRNTLYNKELTEEEKAELFLNTDTTSDTILNIQKQMQLIDRTALGSQYDAKHSELLETVVERIMEVSKTIRDMKLSVSKETVEKLQEPLGEFNPNKPLEPIKLLTSDLGQEARNKFTMSNEEAMAHELVHAALDWVFKHTNVGPQGEALKSQIRKLYAQARDEMVWQDMLDDSTSYTKAEEIVAKKRYDYVFNNTDRDKLHTTRTANARLQEFMAHLMTNKAFQTGVNKLETRPYKAEIKPHENLLEMMVRKFVDYLSSIFHKTRKVKGDTVLEEAVNVVFALTAIQDKYGQQAAASRATSLDEKVTGGINKITGAIDSVVTPVIDKGADLFLGVPKPGMTLEEFNAILDKNNLKIPSKDENLLVRIGKVAVLIRKVRKQVLAEGKFGRDEMGLLWSTIFDKAGIHEDGFTRQLLADFSSGRKVLEQITDATMAFRYHMDRLREENYEGTMKDVYNKMFLKTDLRLKENHKYNKALGEVAMVTDLHSLVDPETSLMDTDVRALSSMIKDPSKEIATIEARLKNVSTVKDINTGERFIQDAKSAAEHMVTGVGLRTNADNITRMFGTPFALPYEGANLNEEHVRDVDKLITLYAIQLTEQVSRDNMIELINNDPKGVREFMRYSRGVQAELKEEYSEVEPYNYMKGQIRETMSRNKDMQLAPMFKRNEMEQLGYKLVRKASTSKYDQDDTSYGWFINEDVLLEKMVDGAMGTQAAHVPGMTLVNKIRTSNPNMQDGKLYRLAFNAVKHAEKIYQRTGKIDGMQPVYDFQGAITDFRYTTPRLDKLTLLDLKTDGSEMLAKSEGNLGAITVTNDQNYDMLELVRKDSLAINDSGIPGKDNTHLYIKIQAKEIKLSEDERKVLYDGGQSELLNLGKYGLKTKGEEIWGMMPPAARKKVINDNIAADLAQLEKDMDNKKSTAYLMSIDPNPETRVSYEKQQSNIENNPRKEFMVRKDLLNQLFGYNEASITDMKIFNNMKVSNKHQVKVFESYWKDIAAILKANLVVKLPATIWANIISNARFLFYSGMPVKKAFELLFMSLKQLDQWKKDDGRLETIKREMRGETGERLDQYKRDLSDLEAKMASNPLAALMAKGMYQSVVEDVVLHEESNKVAAKIEKLGPDKVKNPNLTEVVNTVFLTNKSVAGRFLTRVTQESDFHFRAATYWYGLEQGKSEAEMSREVTDNFINYSKVINSKVIQWLDRVAGQPFWKFSANIQRINLKILRRNPSRVAISQAEQYVFGNSPDIFDSNIFHMIAYRYNPFAMLWNIVRGGTEIPLYNAISHGL